MLMSQFLALMITSLFFSTGLFYAQKSTKDIAAGFNTGYVYNMDAA